MNTMVSYLSWPRKAFAIDKHSAYRYNKEKQSGKDGGKMGRQDMMAQAGGDTGLPADRSYLECGLPDFLRESIAQMQAAWDQLDRGEKDLRWDCDYCNLQTDINNAEVNQVISSEQAWYLRERYLRMELE